MNKKDAKSKTEFSKYSNIFWKIAFFWRLKGSYRDNQGMTGYQKFVWDERDIMPIEQRC
jgi:hypothetical protein